MTQKEQILFLYDNNDDKRFLLGHCKFSDIFYSTFGYNLLARRATTVYIFASLTS